MSRATRIPLLALAIVGLSGCATTGVGPTSSLEHWLDHELAPYLAGELSEKPRFRGERIALVAMRGARPDPQPPRLVERLRQRLDDRLVATPGVTLVAHGGDPCEPPRYQIGFELETDGDLYRLRVRALDAEAGAWVPGFGRTWSGPLTAAERRLADARSDAGGIRGTRETPWRDDEHDLAAAALAAGLRCQLLRGAKLPAAARLTGAEEAAFGRLERLTARRLEAVGAVRVDTAGGWTFAVTEEAIDGATSQIWATLRPDDGGPSFAASTYVSTAATTPPRPTLDAPPLPRLVSDVRDGDCRLRAPLSPDGVDPAACVALEADAPPAARTAVLSLHSRFGLRRLSCGAERGRIRTPSAGGFKGRREGDTETFYALAFGASAGRDVERLLDAVPAECSGVPAGGLTGVALERWLDALEAAMPREDLTWSGLRVHYRDGTALVHRGD